LPVSTRRKKKRKGRRNGPKDSFRKGGLTTNAKVKKGIEAVAGTRKSGRKGEGRGPEEGESEEIQGGGARTTSKRKIYKPVP